MRVRRTASTASPAPCSPGTLPEGPVCVRIPGEEELAARLTAAAPMLPSGARRACRRPHPAPPRSASADAAAYVYPPGGCDARAPRVLPPIWEQPGIRLAAARPGEKVVLLALEHQTGPAEVVFVGDLSSGARW